MEKISTVKMKGKKILRGQLTIGLDLGDRSSCYCVLDENGEIIREQKIPTTPEGMQQAFGKMARSRIAMETGTHSPWVSRVLTELGHEVIVAHAQKISEECCQVGILIFSTGSSGKLTPPPQFSHTLLTTRFSCLRIPTKVITDSDLIPITFSG
jgi:hypothetical protein